MSSPSSPEPFRVLVIGGYGFFGRRLVERLARQPGLHVIVAGRSAQQAAALVARLQPDSRATLGSVALDALSEAFPGWLDRLRVRAVVHASGPFQGQDYRVALACTAAGVHYVDLADGREFVAGIGAVDVAATAAGVCVLSGASSVPALSAAAADALTRGWQRVDAIDIGISPGNRTERGLSTIQAGLGYCGRPDRARRRRDAHRLAAACACIAIPRRSAGGRCRRATCPTSRCCRRATRAGPRALRRRASSSSRCTSA